MANFIWFRVAQHFLAGLCLPFLALAQDPPKFEVASIKRCLARPPGNNAGHSGPKTMVYNCVSLELLIRHSFLMFADGSVRNRQLETLAIEGLPGWAQSELWNVTAKTGTEVGPFSMEGPMLRALLEERFHVKARRVTTEGPVYRLTVTKSGLKAPRTQQPCWTLGNPQPPQPAPGRPPTPICGLPNRRQGGFDLPGASLTDFSTVLMDAALARLDRKVIDATGISGRYDFHVDWPVTPPVASPGEFRAPPDPLDRVQPALEKLGLHLVSGKGPIEKLVVEHAERPTEN